MNEWRAFMTKYYPDGDRNNQFNVYGWAVCSLLIDTLERAGDDLSRENIMKMAASFKKFRVRGLLPGIVINSGPADFFLVEQMQMMRFDGRTNVRFGPVISAETSSE